MNSITITVIQTTNKDCLKLPVGTKIKDIADPYLEKIGKGKVRMFVNKQEVNTETVIKSNDIIEFIKECRLCDCGRH